MRAVFGVVLAALLLLPVGAAGGAGGGARSEPRAEAGRGAGRGTRSEPRAEAGRAARETEPAPQEVSTVVVGSKSFTESVILGEIVARVLRDAGLPVEHRRQLGGTRVLWEALRAGDVDVYPEYTGTIVEEILGGAEAGGPAALGEALAARGVGVAARPGFDNTYVIGMEEERAAELGIRTISDLAGHPGLRLGFSNEFLDRGDGWPALRDRYGLPHEDVVGLDHDLAYRGLESGALDATDLYSTDAEIRFYGLRTLEDDLGHFPAYEAVLLARDDLEERAPGALDALARLDGAIDEAAMRAMNAGVKLDGGSEARVAADFVATALGIDGAVDEEGVGDRLLRNLRGHLFLVVVSLAAAIAVAVPAGIVAARRPRAGQVILGVAGILQTIPSLALFVFLIPVLGIGARPAIAALFLYSLLPIVRNTHAGLHDIPASIRESAAALGLPAGARLRLVELPLAARSILAGVKTSAVINVGTATIAALIGAEGFGQPILTGIRLADTGLIMEGAVPAALLALAAQGAFELAERAVVPRGLRLPASDG